MQSKLKAEASAQLEAVVLCAVSLTSVLCALSFRSRAAPAKAVAAGMRFARVRCRPGCYLNWTRIRKVGPATWLDKRSLTTAMSIVIRAVAATSTDEMDRVPS